MQATYEMLADIDIEFGVPPRHLSIDPGKLVSTEALQRRLVLIVEGPQHLAASEQFVSFDKAPPESTLHVPARARQDRYSLRRSEERHVGKERGSTCRSRWPQCT